MPQWIGVAVGGFADPSFEMPEQAVWASEQHPWLRLPETLSSYPRNPPPRNRSTCEKASTEVSIVTFQDRHFADICELWLEVFPNDPLWNRAEISIAEKIRFQPDLFIVAEREGSVIGTAMAGYDGHRGWLYSIAVRPDANRLGIGSSLLAEAERRLGALGCGKINVQIREGNESVSAFYIRHGYQVERRLSMAKRLPL